MTTLQLPAVDRQHGRRLDRWFTWIGGAVVLGVPLAAFTGLVLSHFYVSGSFLLDAGWTAHLMTHGGLRLRYPSSLGGESYFAYHVSPILVFIALLRRALPVSDIQFVAGFMGLCHALPGLGVFWVLRSRFRPQIAMPVAVIVAVAFAFNGLALGIVRYPHIEILIVGSVILFAVALVRRQVVLAGIFFVIALATREDSGFHVFAILFVVVALNRWHGIPWRQQAPEIAFAAVALTYSIAIVVLQRSISSAPSTLTLTYLGDPPFANLTATTMLLRLLFYAGYRAYLVLPAIIAAIWAARTRNPYIVAGYLAFLPWGLLQLVANTDIAGTLSGYYAYPFMIAAFWPLLGVLPDPRRRRIEGGAATAVLAFSAMVAASFVGIGQQYNPGQLDLPKGFFSPPTLQRQAMTDRAVAQLARSKPALGVVIADTSIVALAPDEFVPSETVLRRSPIRPDTVIYFAQGYESGTARRIAAAAGLAQHYRVPQTAIRIATDRPIAALAPVSALLAASDASD